jgi:hypothetical protein
MPTTKGFARGFVLALLVLTGCTGGPISDFPRGSSDEPTPGSDNAGDGDQGSSFDAGPGESDGDGDTPPDSDGPGEFSDAAVAGDGGPTDSGAADGGAADAGDASADGSSGDGGSSDAGD